MMTAEKQNEIVAKWIDGGAWDREAVENTARDGLAAADRERLAEVYGEAGEQIGAAIVEECQRRVAEELAAPEITDEDRRLLGELCTRDDAGKHFTETFPAEWLDRMEDAGIITISRPTHPATGIPYSQEYWSVGIMPNVPGITDEQGCLNED